MDRKAVLEIIARKADVQMDYANQPVKIWYTALMYDCYIMPTANMYFQFVSNWTNSDKKFG